jgi:hypothetical protein
MIDRIRAMGHKHFLPLKQGAIVTRREMTVLRTQPLFENPLGE